MDTAKPECVDRSFEPRTVASKLLVTIGVIALLAGISPSALAQDAPSVPASSTIDKEVKLAGQGDLQAELRVAKAYYEGIGTRLNLVEGCKWFDRAAAQGSLEGSAYLGHCYVSGQGLAQNVDKGLTLIKNAADRENPAGIRFLGMLYESGNGVQRDPAAAVSLLSKAVKMNDAPSFYHLGRIYLLGIGVEKNAGQAKTLFTQGAKLGDAKSELTLGEMYLREDKTSPSPENVASAKKLFTDAASQGDRVAAFRLAKMYDTGRGGEQDHKKALDYYRISARRGYAPAEVAIGSWNELELNPPNLLHAYVWYSLAADQGSVEAHERLTILSATLSGEQLKQAQSTLNLLRASVRSSGTRTETDVER